MVNHGNDDEARIIAIWQDGRSLREAHKVIVDDDSKDA